MPNWCTNKLIITGPDVPELLNRFSTSEALLSFNQVIPMPEPLEMTAAGHTPLAIAAALRASPELWLSTLDAMQSCPDSALALWRMCMELQGLLDDEKRPALFQAVDEAVARGLPFSSFYDALPDGQDHALTLEELIEIGNTYLSNLKEYQAMDWYDWSVDHWGTKWDLDKDSVTVKLIETHAAILVFDTAWSPPIPVIVRMGQLCPEYRLRLTWHECGVELQGRLDVCGETAEAIHHDYQRWRETRDLRSVAIPARMRWKGAAAEEAIVLPDGIEEVLARLVSAGETGNLSSLPE